MSKRKQKTRHKQVRQLVSDHISVALEDAVKRKVLKRHEVNIWYGKLSKCGLWDLGFEPVFRWKWPRTPPAWALKHMIRGRIPGLLTHNKSKLNLEEKLTKLRARRSSTPTKQSSLRSRLKLKTS